MNQKGFANIILAIIGVVMLVGAVGYFVVSKRSPSPESVSSSSPTSTPEPTPTPEPVNIPSLRFEASPMLGPPPLNVSIGAFSQTPLQFDTFILDYGDGLQEILNQQCISGVCQVRSIHKYTSSGTFTAILYGKKNGDSQALGTITISVGNPLIVTKTVGEKEGSFLIQKINRDSVEGLWYRKYPVATTQGTPKTLHIGDDIGYSCEGVSDKLTSIDFFGQKISFTVSWGQPSPGGCPICLAGSTLIDTPSGQISIKDLRVGMSVWTMDKNGRRVSGLITKTSKVPVPRTYQMVRVVLGNSQELLVSPGHPTVDGRAIGDLAPGDLYNGVLVVSAERVPYDEGATYDILPSGDTGFYWANGILLGSTLHKNRQRTAKEQN